MQIERNNIWLINFGSSINRLDYQFWQFENEVDKLFDHRVGIGEYGAKLSPLIDKASDVGGLEPVHDLVCHKEENEKG